MRKLPRASKIAVMLRLEIMSGRQQLVGIYRYMKQHARRWNTVFVDRSSEPDDISGFDGIICSEALLGNLQRKFPTETPIVALNTAPELLADRKIRTARIDVDNGEIGRLAARHVFSRGGLRAAAFISDPEDRLWSRQRCAAFEAEARTRKLPFCRFLPQADKTAKLSDWLTSLPRPCAVMVAYDAYAVQVLEAIRDVGIRVPEQMLVISVDNDGLYCDYTQPTLSSVDPDFESSGFLAAAELDAMLCNKRRKANRLIMQKPKLLIERESTAFLQPAASLVNRAFAYIRDNAVRGISARDVAHAMGVSRRLLDLRFQQFCENTVNDLIRKKQVEKMRELLSDTQMTIDQVAATSGFRNGKYAKRLFKRHCQMTMSDYRRQKQPT